MRVAVFVLVSLALESFVLAPPLRAQGSTPSNILLILADDLGVDRVGAYAEHPDPGRTPHIDALAARGVLFRNAWADPVCSSSRAAMLTGRYGFRTGVGRGIGQYNDRELSIDTPTLADALRPAYATAFVGKWHLHSTPGSNYLVHPFELGFDFYGGGMDVFPLFIGDGYSLFVKNSQGSLGISTTYATTDEADDALFLTRWLPEPWFVVLSFHAPHAPFHKPPAHLHTQTLPASVAGNIPVHAKAAVEAMDTEIGRLFAGMDPDVLADTVVLFMGDNGTDGPATTWPFDPWRAKKTIYEGGINVPLIVAGPGVAVGAESAALVDSSDLFATIADIAGAPHDTATDSVSFLPHLLDPSRPSTRPWVYAEFFDANGWGPYLRNDRTVRDTRHKLLRFHLPWSHAYREEFYDLVADPWEHTNLLLGVLTPEQQSALDGLRQALSELYVPWVESHPGLAGSFGAPRLTGEGPLAAGTPVQIELSGARPNSWGLLFVGLQQLNAPLFGGTLVPDAWTAGTQFVLPTTAAGGFLLSSTWPAGLEPGTSLWLQHWHWDPGAVQGAAASNALRAMTPP